MTTKPIIEQVAEEREAEKNEKNEKAALLKKKDSWKEEGFIVLRLEELDKKPLDVMQDEYGRFEIEIVELRSLRSKLERLDRDGFDSDFMAIETDMNNPDKIAQLREAVDGLVRRIEERKERLQKEAKEEERLLAQLRLKTEQEERMKAEYEAKNKEEESKKAQLDIQMKRERRLEKQIENESKKLELISLGSEKKLKKEELKLAKIELKKAKKESEKLQSEMKLKEEERLARERNLELKTQERLVLELETKKLEEERLNAELQSKLKDEERNLKELEKQRLKEERLCKELGLKELKEEQKLAKLDEKKQSAEAKKLAQEAKLKEEATRLEDLEALGKKRDMAIAAAEARKAMEERMRIEAQAQKIRERKQALMLELENKRLEKEDISKNLKAIEKDVADVKKSLEEPRVNGQTAGSYPIIGRSDREKHAIDAKTFENDIINDFMNKMQAYPIRIPILPKKRGEKRKDITVSEWQTKKSSIRPFKVMKDDFIKVKMIHHDVSKEQIPVNRIVYYVVPKKIAVGVWVCSRPERYVGKKQHNPNERLSVKELNERFKTLRELESSLPIKVFALYSVTGWDDKNHSEKPIPSEPNLMYSIKEMRDDCEISSKTNGFNDYGDFFPKIGKLPTRGIVKAKPKKADAEPKPEIADLGHSKEVQNAAAAPELTTANLEEMLRKVLQSQSQPPLMVDRTVPEGGAPAPSAQPQAPPPQEKDPILQTQEEWKTYVNSLNFNGYEQILDLGKKAQAIKELDDASFWPIIRIIWKEICNKIIEGAIDRSVLEKMIMVWNKDEKNENYFCYYKKENYLDTYIEYMGRNPVGILFYLVCKKLEVPIQVDNYGDNFISGKREIIATKFSKQWVWGA